MSNRKKENIMQAVFFSAACVSILAVILICVYLFANGIPAMAKIGLFNFLMGKEWRPGSDIYGILPMILGSIYVTAGAVLLGVPTGILTAVFLSYYCPKKWYRPLKTATELLAGIPSIVYGFFGLLVLVPFVRSIDPQNTDGNSIATAAILLGMMILPTVIGVSESALCTVPKHYYEGALALGATKERSIFLVMIPAAKSGILAGAVLGIGRAIGETMAVMMVAGNQPRMPKGILQGVRTLTSNIVMEMGYAVGLHREALIATAVILFVFILVINVVVSCLKHKMK